MIDLTTYFVLFIQYYPCMSSNKSGLFQIESINQPL